MTDGRPPLGDGASDAASVPLLAARLWADAAALIRAEIALAGVEARLALRGLVTGAAAMGLALVLALGAVVALTGAAVAGLVQAGLSPALAGLVVAVVALILAGLAVWWGVSRLRRAAGMPARTVQTLRRDVETLATMVNPNA